MKRTDHNALSRLLAELHRGSERFLDQLSGQISSWFPGEPKTAADSPSSEQREQHVREHHSGEDLLVALLPADWPERLVHAINLTALNLDQQLHLAHNLSALIDYWVQAAASVENRAKNDG